MSYHYRDLPVTSMSELSILLIKHAELGAEFCELFIAEKLCDKAFKQLRKSGFKASYLKFKANDNWRLAFISWEK